MPRNQHQVKVILTDEQLAVLDQICGIDPERAYNRAETLRYALQRLAAVHGIAWPNNLAPHGDFARARAKRWNQDDK